MELLDGPVRDYDWGSVVAIPELLGRPPTGRPWAELWLGAHHSAPSLVGAAAEPLDALVAADPDAMLGPEVARRFGELPFMLKVLAAAAPLSLQAHPSAAQARAGFEKEEAAGIPLDAPHRSFRDRSHKPELLCALTRFEALCGFRDPVATLDLLTTIDTPALDAVRDRIASDPSPAGMTGLLGWLLTLDPGEASRLVAAVAGACRNARGARGALERHTAIALAERYPHDAGVVTALLLNHVVLEPGEALFLGSGNLHAYLRGTGVEIMANSDNVLRGGLTSKPVDVLTLLDVVDASPFTPTVQRPEPIDGVATFVTPVAEFALQRAQVDGTATLDGGPAILLCVEGAVHGAGHTLDRGTAAWVPATEDSIVLTGRGTVFRAGVGDHGAVEE